MIDKLGEGGNARTLLVLLMVVGTVSAGMGGLTYSYFQDTDSTSANPIQSGTLNVTIDGIDDGTTNDFTITNAKPLDTATKNYSIQNGGSAAADHLQINVSYTENDPTGPYEQEPGDSDLNKSLNGSEMAKYLEVTSLTYHNGTSSTNLLSSVNDGNNNNIVDLADIQNASVMDDLTPPKVKEGNTTYFEITIRVASDEHGLQNSNDEDIMGDGVDVTIHFTLMQDRSQD